MTVTAGFRSSASSLLEGAESLLQSPVTKLVLSFLIVLSVLPAATLAGVLPLGIVARLDLVFLSLFGPEFLLRVATYARRLREGRSSAWEPVLLAADLVALVSFLPLHRMFPSTAYFRLFRLTRMLLLLGYWGDMLGDLWRILTGSERRYQVAFVFLLGLVLSFAGAVILLEFAPAYDYDNDGQLTGRDRRFLSVLWWSFRQVQDPGNLAAQPSDAVVVGVSLVLTFAGLLLLSFVIGISTGAMDELLRRSRDRPVGLRDHSVILGLAPYSSFLLEELVEIYRKNRKVARGAVLGPTERPPAYFHERRMRSFVYRGGDPVRAADLERVDVARAKRILVLGTGGEEPDARVIAATLAVRGRNPQAALYADLEHEKNFAATRAAGGPRTRVVGSGPFLGFYVAQNVIYPGVYRAYRQLLTSAGCEIYTYILDPAERRQLLERASAGSLDPQALFARAYLEHQVTLLGFFVAEDEARPSDPDELGVLLNPASVSTRRRFAFAFDGDARLRQAALRGLVGVAARWEDLRSLAGALLVSPEQTRPFVSPAGFPDLILDAEGGRVRRVLICGGSPRVPRVVSELAAVFAPLEITVLVRAADHRAPLEEAIGAALEGYLFSLPGGGTRPHVRARGATVRVLHADWSDAGSLLRNPALDLARTDAMLFLPRDPADVTDGLVALDCLRIAEFGASGVVALRPGFRVVALVRDPLKSDLLEARLDEIAGPGAEARFTVVSSERLRNHFLVQNLFVPGLNAVLLEMLGASGQHLARLVPRTPDGAPRGDFDPWDLARYLYAAHRVVPVGIERLGASGRADAILDPAELAAGRRIAWDAVRALYVLGEVPGLRPSPSAAGP